MASSTGDIKDCAVSKEAQEKIVLTSEELELIKKNRKSDDHSKKRLTSIGEQVIALAQDELNIAKFEDDYKRFLEVAKNKSLEYKEGQLRHFERCMAECLYHHMECKNAETLDKVLSYYITISAWCMACGIESKLKTEKMCELVGITSNENKEEIEEEDEEIEEKPKKKRKRVLKQTTINKSFFEDEAEEAKPKKKTQKEKKKVVFEDEVEFE